MSSFRSSIVECVLSSPFSGEALDVNPLEARRRLGRAQLGNLARTGCGKSFTSLSDLFSTLKSGALSAIVVRSVVPPIRVEALPNGFIDRSVEPIWFPLANSILAMLAQQGIHVVSYSAENSGELFVHLVPNFNAEDDTDKSLRKLRGHTDGVVFRLWPDDFAASPLPLTPGFVVLGCLANDAEVATHVAPIRAVLEKLTKADVDVLMEPRFSVSPQASFAMGSAARPGYSVLRRDPMEGYQLRFSHSCIKPMSETDNAAVSALSGLQEAIASSYEKIVLGPGDVAVINNRTAIHGRGEVGRTHRWLIRTYGVSDEIWPEPSQQDTSFCLA
jgi:L-asparagine oxygenase